MTFANISAWLPAWQRGFLALGLAIIMLAGVTANSTVAQDVNGNEQDADKPASDLIEKLRSTPASKLDVGLQALTTKEWIYFAVNKPDVLKKDRNRFLSVEYIDFKGEIHVELSHTSIGSTPDELATECRQDIALEVAALVPELTDTAISEAGDASNQDRLCRKITSEFYGNETTGQFLTREMKQSGDNVCRHFQFYARVSNVDGKPNVHCTRDFFSSNIKVWVE